MTSRIRVAVVGVGALGEHHARIYSQLPDAELVAVVDTRADRAGEIAARFQCRALVQPDQLPPEVEAVSLAAPTELHAEVGVKLMERGFHVLIEKPMARTLEQADELIAARDRTGLVLQIGHSERFNPAFQAVLPYVSAPRFFEGHRLGVFAGRSLDVDVVLDLMIHDVDLVLRLVNSPVREIRAVGIPVLTPRVDIANARIEFENGAVANLTASRVSRERVRKLRFFQAHDYVSIDFHRREVEVFSLVESEKGRQIVQRSPEVSSVEPLHLELEAFLAACRGGVSAGCTGEEGRYSLALALGILEASKRTNE